MATSLDRCSRQLVVTSRIILQDLPVHNLFSKIYDDFLSNVASNDENGTGKVIAYRRARLVVHNLFNVINVIVKVRQHQILVERMKVRRLVKSKGSKKEHNLRRLEREARSSEPSLKQQPSVLIFPSRGSSSVAFHVQPVSISQNVFPFIRVSIFSTIETNSNLNIVRRNPRLLDFWYLFHESVPHQDS